MSIESGKQYSISEIFSGDKRIIVPDLQRDYCWGNKQNLAVNFLKSLIELYEKEGNGLYKQASLGLIYAYENPRNFVNIADGQQRITTLYLLLCVIYRLLSKTEENSAIKKEMENFITLKAEDTVWEPRLRYEVRESTVYFIKAFLNNEIRDNNATNEKKEKISLKEDIEKASWFRDEYKSDPSIQSMLGSISSFYEELKNHNELNLNKFAYFILGITPDTVKENLENFVTKEENNNIREKLPKDFNSISRLCAGHSGICFVYFDVEDRDFGEKMYVIINTRGAPMEPNEHLKPLLISKLSDDEQIKWTKKWENWQDFFWQNRKQDEESSGDKGFNDFLDWILQIWLKQDKTGGKGKTQSIANIFSDILNKKKVKLDFINSTHKTENDALLLLKEIEKYVIVLNHLTTFAKEEENFQNIFNQINSEILDKDKIQLRSFNIDQQQNILLPLLSFMVKISCEKEECYIFLRRLRKNYFNNDKVSSGRIRTGKYIDWRYILGMIELCNKKKEGLDKLLKFDFDEDIIKQFKDKYSRQIIIDRLNQQKDWYDLEEKIKDNIFNGRNNPVNINDFQKTLFNYEDHEDFAGDITPLLLMYLLSTTDSIDSIQDLKLEKLWNYLESQQESIVDAINRYFSKYQKFEELIVKKDNNLKESNDLKNFYRLFKLLISCFNWGHIHGYNYRMEGTNFSLKNLNHLKIPKFYEFIIKDQPDFKEYVKTNFIKTYLNNLTNNQDSLHKKLVYVWIILKVLDAESELLSYHDTDDKGKRRIAAYNEKDEFENNKIFNINTNNSIANFQCGHASKNHITYANNNWWGKKEALDGPVGPEPEFIIGYQLVSDIHNGNLDQDKIIQEAENKIEEQEEYIKGLLREFFDNNKVPSWINDFYKASYSDSSSSP